MAENGSIPIRLISDAQASILDFVLFPGFTRMSTAVQEHLMVDLSLYIPLLCIFGLLLFISKRIYIVLVGWIETHFTSTVHVQYREEAYDMLLLWTSSQTFNYHVRSSLATTELGSTWTRLGRSNAGNTKAKSIYYTPWNGRFFMRYKGQLLVFRRQYRDGEFNSREEVSVSCFSRSPQILKELLSECCAAYSKLVQDKTSLYEHQDDSWAKSKVMDKRPISTVILNETLQRELLKDIGDFLDPTAQKWYSTRGIPYRKGYLLYGPPGTGKSSLSFALAGVFALDIYILSLSTLNDASLRSLFAKLPGRCVILLEDIDAFSSNRSRDSPQIATASSSEESKSVGGKVSLSALLNVIDGVASQEGRVLIMTTNHITRLDEALIRPGRIDKRVELGLADKQMVADLFYIVFKPAEGDFTPQKNTQLDVYAAATDQGNEVQEVKLLADEFATRVPELKFSPAAILSFLLENRKSPEEAVHNAEQLILKFTEAKLVQPISEDAKPPDAQPGIALDSK